MVDYPDPRTIGVHGGTTVVALHGFTQTGDCLGPLAEQLATRHRVVLPDLPGHGVAAGLAHLDCAATARALAERSGPAHWVGYSMGGRIALHVALNHPRDVLSLVLIGTSAGIEDPAGRAARANADLRRAAHLESVGVRQFCEEWLAMEMFTGLPDKARFLPERTSNSVEGLAGSLRNAGVATMAPMWDRLGELSMPVLLVAGERDDRYVALSRRMAAAIGPGASVGIVDGAGHAVHLEQPRTTVALLDTFLDRCDGVRSR